MKKYAFGTVIAISGIIGINYLMQPEDEIKYDYNYLFEQDITNAPEEIKPDYNAILLYTRETISFACDTAGFFGQDGEIHSGEKQRIINKAAARFGLTEFDQPAIENFMVHATELGCAELTVLLTSDTTDSYTVQRGNRTATFDANTGARK